MNIIGRTISTFVTNAVRQVKIYALGRSVRTPYQVAAYGIDSNPIENMQAIFAPTSNSNTPGVIIGYINTGALAAIGEARMFSTDNNGNFKANIWCRNDGTILLGADNVPADYNDFLVKFNELQTSILNLQTALNSHTHATGAGESAPPTIPFTIDISSAKAVNLKTV